VVFEFGAQYLHSSLKGYFQPIPDIIYQLGPSIVDRAHSIELSGERPLAPWLE
jgi:hypothetical protein